MVFVLPATCSARANDLPSNVVTPFQGGAIGDHDGVVGSRCACQQQTALGNGKVAVLVKLRS